MLSTIQQAILEAEQRFYEENVTEPTHIVLRPEVKARLEEELGYDWQDNLYSYMGLILCVCDDPTFPNFKLGAW